MKHAFPFVSIISESDIGTNGRNTFIVIGAKEKLDLQDVCKGYCKSDKIWYMNDSDMALLDKKSKGLILTDDYAPVEQLMTPVIKADAESGATARKG